MLLGKGVAWGWTVWWLSSRAFCSASETLGSVHSRLCRRVHCKLPPWESSRVPGEISGPLRSGGLQPQSHPHFQGHVLAGQENLPWGWRKALPSTPRLCVLQPSCHPRAKDAFRVKEEPAALQTPSRRAELFLPSPEGRGKSHFFLWPRAEPGNLAAKQEGLAAGRGGRKQCPVRRPCIMPRGAVPPAAGGSRAYPPPITHTLSHVPSARGWRGPGLP